MCVICTQWELGKLTRVEARRALHEMINTDLIDDDHAEAVELMIKEENGQGKKENS